MTRSGNSDLFRSSYTLICCMLKSVMFRTETGQGNLQQPRKTYKVAEISECIKLRVLIVTAGMSLGVFLIVSFIDIHVQ